MRPRRLSSLALAVLVLGPAPLARAAQGPVPGGGPAQRPAGEEGPARERGLVVRTERACEGYTLFAPLRSRSTYLVDLDGAVVREWKSDLGPGNSVYLLPNGHLLRCGRVTDNPVFHGGGSGGRLREYDRAGEVVWEHVLSSEALLQHHDVEPLANGNVLVIAWERRTKEQALAAGRDPVLMEGEELWPDMVLELRPVRPRGAEVVWEWHSWDHLVQDRDPELASYGDPLARAGRIDVNGDARERRLSSEEQRALEELGYATPAPTIRQEGRDADWLHTNAISYDPERDLIVLSARRFDELWVIDHSTTTEEAKGSTGGRWGHGGDLLYRWGNPQTYAAGTVEDQRFFGQHDARWIPAGRPGAGDLMVFNNGGGRPGGEHSSVEQLHPPFDAERGFVRAEGAAFGPAAPVWSYAAPEPAEFFSSFISGAERLPNGNTLVCEGAEGRLFEVTSDGEIAWEYLNPYGGDIEMGVGPRGQGRGGPPGGPPDGPPPGDGRAGRGRPGPPGGPGDGRGPGRGGPRGGGPGGGGPGLPVALFRATRIAPDDPGLVALLAVEDAAGE